MIASASAKTFAKIEFFQTYFSKRLWIVASTSANWISLHPFFKNLPNFSADGLNRVIKDLKNTFEGVHFLEKL